MTTQKESLRFRQIHLDFHTSPYIEKIGGAFNKQKWQETLKKGHVDSVTTFATCHHGWSYYKTKVGQMHPHLSFDLLRAQYDASKEIGVNVPIYLTAGVNNWASYNHPEWREVNAEGRYTGWQPNTVQAGFHKMCFNSPYIDLLCKQIEEVALLYPDCDGIFLDIINQNECTCKWCLDGMEKAKLDFTVQENRKIWSKMVLLEYYKKTTAAATKNDKNMKIFHNSGHIEVGNRKILPYFSHLELESLPTGGWGYDHFPMSAAYVRNLNKDFLGMTGKFHTTWGEFGGYKHPNALRYECAAMIAYGARCSVGDQLDPSATLDETTYSIIGEAYSEVEEKEKWCKNATAVSDIAILSAASTLEHSGRENSGDYGAGRMLLEEHIMFDMVDGEADFSKYKALLLPDEVMVNAPLKTKIDKFIASGGKLILSGTSALDAEKKDFLFDIGAKYYGVHEFNPDYLLPSEEFQPTFVKAPMVMYAASTKIKAKKGNETGVIYPSFFNRKGRHFCSHQHAPVNLEGEKWSAGSITKNILYIAHPVFSLYRGFGQVALRQTVGKMIKKFLGKDLTIDTNIPSQSRITLTQQKKEKQYVTHLLFANKLYRGGEMHLSGGTVGGALKGIEVIEELLPLCHTKVSLTLPEKVTAVTLEPQGEKIAFEQKDGKVMFEVKEFTCHQMVVLKY